MERLPTEEGDSDRGDISQRRRSARRWTGVPNATFGEDVAVGTRNEHQGAGVAGMVIQRYPKMNRALRRAECSRAEILDATPRSQPRGICRPRRRSGTKPGWTRGWPQPLPGRSRATRQCARTGSRAFGQCTLAIGGVASREGLGSAGGAGYPSGRRAGRLVPRRSMISSSGRTGSVTRRNPSSLYCDKCSCVSIDGRGPRPIHSDGL